MGDPADTFRKLPPPRLLWSVVDSERASCWVEGILSDGPLVLNEVRQPVVLLQQMTGRGAWRALLDEPKIWRHTSAVCRTDQPGLIRLLDDAGAERGFVEPSGQIRYAIGPAAFVAIHSKLRRTYAPEVPSRLRGDQFPVMAEKHGLAMASL